MCSLFSHLLNIDDVSKLAILMENIDLVNEINTRRDNFGKNIFHSLTNDQNVEVLRLLLDRVDKRLINERSASGHTPLCFGLTANATSEEFFLLLLSHQECDVNIPDKRHLTPLHYAVFHNEHRITKRILDRGAYIDGISITGITPLYLAVEKNNYEMVCMLLYYNADVNVESEENNPYSRDITSPILHCITEGFFDIAELLLDYISDIDEPYSTGLTILYHAILNESQVSQRLLIQVLDAYGYGKLFWTFVYVNVELIDFKPIQAEKTLSRFLFDLELTGYCIISFWRRHFATDALVPIGPYFADNGRIPCPSLQELSRTAVRRYCRPFEDMRQKRPFTFINRIKSIGLPKILEDILLLRRGIYLYTVV